MTDQIVESALNLTIVAFLLMLTIVFVSGACVIIVSTIREINQ